LEKAEPITLIALLDVVRKNDLEKLNLLLNNISKNPERTKLISDFKVVLHQTAALNHIECARMLIENGFSLLERDEFNCTPFSIAALYGHLEIVYYFATQLTPENLIEQSIEALSYAAFMKHMPLINLLIKYIIDMDILRDPCGIYLLERIIRTPTSSMIEFVRKSIEGKKIDWEDSKRMSTARVYSILATVFGEDEYLFDLELYGFRQQLGGDSYQMLRAAALGFKMSVVESILDNYDSSFLNDDDKEVSTLKHKNTILKIRSCVTIDDPDIVAKFQDLFDRDSSEVLLKRYKCVYINQSNVSLGKMYISSSYLCFVESKFRKLELVIRLEDVENYTTDDSGVNIVAYGQLHTFKEFSSESWLGFLSNYLRLIKKTNSPVKLEVGTDCSSISTSISSLCHRGSPSDCTGTPKLTEADQCSLSSKNSGGQKMLSLPQSSQSQQAPQFSSLPLLDLKTPLDNTIAMVSDVAYKASCIPLLILTRVLSFGMGIATSSLQITAPSNFLPPRAFTKNIAYIMLAFLAISMSYIYCHLEHLPIDDPTWVAYGSSHKNAGSGFDCRGEFEKLASSLHSLSETLQRLEARLVEDEVMMNLRTVP
uniref:ANK_REP_REGION domain-containing protein n=1 Tax=Hymenolepis diminuta TaxID=6216 RepID=A0A158QFR8_HYMDI